MPVRDFTKNASNLMTLPINSIGPLVNGAAKISIHCWAYVDTLTSSGVLQNDNGLLSVVINNTIVGLRMGLADEDGGGNTGYLYVAARAAAAETTRIVETLSSIAVGAWYSLGGMVNIGGDFITPYINGVATNGAAASFTAGTYTNGTPTAVDRIGAIAALTTGQLDGRLMEIAIWNDDITAANFLALKNGATADTIMRSNLVFYLKLDGGEHGEAGPEVSEVGNISATITGSLPLSGGTGHIGGENMHAYSVPMVARYRTTWR